MYVLPAKNKNKQTNTKQPIYKQETVQMHLSYKTLAGSLLNVLKQQLSSDSHRYQIDKEMYLKLE